MSSNVQEQKIKLGLGDPPDPIYLFVGEEQDTQTKQMCPWYEYDFEAGRTIPIAQRALTGYIRGLRVHMKEFRGDWNNKLDITVQADTIYVIRSGAETTFTRGVLLALENLTAEDLTEPLVIVATNGDNKVVFGRVHRANGERLKMEWDAERKVLPIINALQQKLGQAPQTIEDIKATATQQIEQRGGAAASGRQQAAAPAGRAASGGQQPAARAAQPRQQAAPAANSSPPRYADDGPYEEDAIPF